MGRSIGKRGRGIPMPIMPTENIGMMSGAIRKKRGDKKRDERGSRRDVRSLGLLQVTMQDPKPGQLYGGLVKDGVPQFKSPDGSTPQGFPAIGASGRGIRQPPPGYKYDEIDRLVPIDTPPIGERPKDIRKIRKETFRRRPLTGGYDPKSGVRYTDTGVPTAVEQTRRVPVQDPTLGGPPEREVPIPKERRQKITRESDPRGGAPFSPDERAMARDRFFETMFDRADERKQQKAMERAERDNVGDALRSERELRSSEFAGPGDERQGRRGEGGMRRRRRRGGGVRSARRRVRRRDFTRRRSQMEGGRRGRSGREMAEFRDRYVSTLR